MADFPKFLGLAMEMYLLMCDDIEADVRMMADECLNKTIKVRQDYLKIYISTSVCIICIRGYIDEHICNNLRCGAKIDTL